MGYPKSQDSMQDNYLVVGIEPVRSPELKNMLWNFRKLSNYKGGRKSAFPFTTTLAELMRNLAADAPRSK